jgi:hypothetical protein
VCWRSLSKYCSHQISGPLTIPPPGINPNIEAVHFDHHTPPFQHIPMCLDSLSSDQDLHLSSSALAWASNVIPSEFISVFIFYGIQLEYAQGGHLARGIDLVGPKCCVVCNLLDIERQKHVKRAHEKGKKRIWVL